MKYFYILLLLIFTSCQFLSGNHIFNEDIKKVFTKNEVIELKQILDYFDRKILLSTNEANVSDAYIKFFQNLSESESFEKLEELLNPQDSGYLDIKDLKVFTAIWLINDQQIRVGDSLNFDWPSYDC